MPRTKQPKKKTRGQLLRECDKYFRQIVLSQRINACEWCGSGSKGLQIAHILPKGTYPSLRYEFFNILLLCWRCHFHKWHKSPLEAEEFISYYKFRGYKEYLVKLSATSPALTNYQLELYLDCFKKTCKSS